MPFPLPQPQQIQPNVESIFRAIDVSRINRGSLIMFSYGMWKHDPYPLVLVSSVRPGGEIKGVNIHYLTFPFVKQILRMAPLFSYQSIKGNTYLTDAFREYKWNGIRQIKSLNIDLVLTMMATVRTMDPNQMEAIRNSVQRQLQRVVNEAAKPTVAGQKAQPQTQTNQVGINLGENPPDVT